MKALFIILLAISLLAIACAGLVFYARMPAFPEADFPSEGTVTLHQFGSRALSSMPHQLTVVSYNMGYASAEKNNQAVELIRDEVVHNMDTMIGALKELDPDMVLLQEVDFNAARTFGIDQMLYVAQGLQMPYAAYAVTWNKRYVPWPCWPPHVHFGRMLSGQAVLSRLPLADQEVIRFLKPESNAIWYNWFYPDRGVQKMHIEMGGERAKIWNIHLEAFNPDTRKEQLSTLSDLIELDRDTLLAAGDYNEKPDALAQDTRLSKTGFGVDWILFSDELKLLDHGHLGISSSDHPPVWAKFRTLSRH